MRPKTSGGFLSPVWALTGEYQNVNSIYLVRGQTAS